MKKRHRKPVTFTDTEYMMFLSSDVRFGTKRQRDLMSARRYREMKQRLLEASK